MRKRYIMMPSDYSAELKKQGVSGAQKSDAFKGYYEDMELGVTGIGVRSYAERWRVSKSTAQRWIVEFKEQIDLFIAHWELKNNQHYSSAKKEAGHLGHFERDTWDTDKPREHGQSKNKSGHLGHFERDKNKLDNNNMRAHVRMKERMAENFFMIYRLNNGKYTGRRDAAIEEYMKIDDVNDHQLLLALSAYKDSGEKMVGAAKFLEDRVYLNYIKINVRVKVEDEWITGEYDSSCDLFVSSDGRRFVLTAQRMAAKMADGELSFEIGEVA